MSPAVGADLYVQHNDSLASLAGLEGRTIGEDLLLDLNPALTDVTALAGVTDIANDVSITGNVSLGDAAAQALIDEIDAIGGTVTVAGDG